MRRRCGRGEEGARRRWGGGEDEVGRRRGEVRRRRGGGEEDVMRRLMILKSQVFMLERQCHNMTLQLNQRYLLRNAVHEDHTIW